ncbi:phage virion morphogenesis protein, partial [Escherichia coli]|nr:phage virion morphogenesis protein [Escherichia coli]
IACVHHYGLRDRVSRRGLKVQYPERRLLGFTKDISNLNLGVYLKR